MSRIAATHIQRVEVPITPPVRGLETRPAWIVTLLDDAGRIGRGEVAPWPGFGDGLEAAEAALATLPDALIGQEPSERLLPQVKEVRAAVDSAFRDLAGTLDVTGTFRPLGAKAKVGDDLAAAVQLVGSLGAGVRVDANGAWSVAEAIAAIDVLSQLDVDFFEQPCATLEELADVRRATGARIAVDELATDLDRVIELAAADVVVLKPSLVGGLGETLRLATQARAAGLEVVVTHAFESQVGRRAVLNAACVLGARAIVGEGPNVTRADPVPVTDALPNPLQSAALARPDHPAIVAGGRSLSFAELKLEVATRAETLYRIGVRAGAAVQLRGGDRVEHVIAWHAVQWLGAHPAPDAACSVDCAALRPAERQRPERTWPDQEVRLALDTSGTTGEPRRIELTTRQLTYSAFGSAIRLGHHLNDRWLCCMPLNHVAGQSILMRCALLGTTVVLHERFDAQAVAAALDRGDVSLVSLVPTMLERVLDARPAEPFPSALRVVLLGGGPIPDALLERCAAIGVPVAATWGMTELASQIATALPGSGAGALPPLAVARITAAANGRLVVTGPIAQGVMTTADLGTVTDGCVRVDGRADDVILSGGENIDPARVEQVLMRHPDVAEAAVFRVPSTTWGFRPEAALVARDGGQASDDELNRWCAQHLSAFEVPDAYHWTEELPKTALGKIQRRALTDWRRP